MSSTISTYGAPFVDEVPTVNPQGELSAASLNLMCRDLSGLTQTGPMARFQFTGSATAPAIASTGTWAAGFDSIYGNSTAVQPTLTRTTTGTITIVMPASVTDPLTTDLTPILINVKSARAYVASGTTHGDIIASVSSSNTITLSMQTLAGSASDLVGSLIVVELT